MLAQHSTRRLAAERRLRLRTQQRPRRHVQELERGEHVPAAGLAGAGWREAAQERDGAAKV